MKYENVSFNTEVIKKMTIDEFVNHRSRRHLWPELSEEKRKERLKELYNLVKSFGEAGTTFNLKLSPKRVLINK